MNIDKFGHHIHKRLRLSELFDIADSSLRKTPNGEYNLNFTKLKGVKPPTEDDEVVNKEYLDHRLELFYSKQDIDIILEKIKKDILIQFKVLITNLKTEDVLKTSQLKTGNHSRSFLDKIDFVPQ